MAEPHHELDPETAPDPDEDDLSDLDDMLDEFSATRIDERKPTASIPSTARPGKPTVQALVGENDDFANQMQAGMAELLGQFQSNPEMQQEFEKMMKDIGAAAGEEGLTEGTASPGMAPSEVVSGQVKSTASKKAGEESFQDTIRKTMERMQNSGETASAAATSSSEEDMLAQMLKEMEKGNFPGMDGQGNEEDFNRMLLGMMEQLTNKDILYDPMKELYDKFPAWLEQNRATTNKEDLLRYEEQHSLVSEIVGRFERKGYSDDNKQDRDYIVERMQKMQAAGSPPPDLVGDMNSAQEAMADMEGGCPQQ